MLYFQEVCGVIELEKYINNSVTKEHMQNVQCIKWRVAEERLVLLVGKNVRS